MANVFAKDNGLSIPAGIAFAPDKNLYICNLTQALQGQILQWLANGNFGKIFATTNRVQPRGLAAQGSAWFVADASNYTVQVYADNGAYADLFATAGGLTRPQGIVFGPDGNLYVACSMPNQAVGQNPTLPSPNSSILRYNGTSGAFMGVFASGGGLDFPTFLVFN